MEEVTALWLLSKDSHLEDILLNERTRTGCKKTIPDSDNHWQEKGAESEVSELEDKTRNSRLRRKE
jgi:hypothetical protein